MKLRGEVVLNHHVAIDADGRAARRHHLHRAACLRESYRAGAEGVIVAEDQVGAGIADDCSAAVSIYVVHREQASAFIDQISRSGKTAEAGVREDVIKTG